MFFLTKIVFLLLLIQRRCTTVKKESHFLRSRANVSPQRVLPLPRGNARDMPAENGVKAH